MDFERPDTSQGSDSRSQDQQQSLLSRNEFPGFGGIEIFTQPGSDKWHGSGSFDFNDESLNSRNPFTTRRTPYQQRSYGGSLSGPIVKKRASFSVYLGRYVSDSNSVVNATILDQLPWCLRAQPVVRNAAAKS